MNHEIICAGFGGQGVLTTGLIIANAGHKAGKHVTWYPSYGSEMRGGTANCNVKISNEEIGNPYCTELSILIAMNEPAIARFEEQIIPGGLLIYNADLTTNERTFREDIQAVPVAVAYLAKQAGNPKGQNIVPLGVLSKIFPEFNPDIMKDAICYFFESKGKGKFNELNKAVFDAGYASR